MKRLRDAVQDVFAETAPVRIREAARRLRETPDRRALGIGCIAEILRARISGRSVRVCLAQAFAGLQQGARVFALGAHDLVDGPCRDCRLGKFAHPFRCVALSSCTKLNREHLG